MNPKTPTPPAGSQPKKAPSNLRLRVIWASLAAALLIACTFGGPISFGLFFAAVQAVMLKEFYRIMRAKNHRPAFWWGIAAGTLLFLLVSYQLVIYPSYEGPFAAIGWVFEADSIVYAGVLLLALGLPVALLIRAILLWPRQQQPFDSIAITMLGLLYISAPMTALNYLALGGEGFTPGRVFLLIFFVWAADTGAYFAGKNFGKHKLAPSISPGKTWEGWAGGAALTLLVGGAAGYFLPDIPLGHRLVAAGVVAVFGPLGDLAESMLKRSAGVKDSGTFLPGHGGLLDRFDAFLLVLPVLALLQALVG